MKTSDVEVRQLLRQIQDARLRVSNVRTPLDWEGNISARGLAKRDAAIRQMHLRKGSLERDEVIL